MITSVTILKHFVCELAHYTMWNLEGEDRKHPLTGFMYDDRDSIKDEAARLNLVVTPAEWEEILRVYCKASKV